jgi:uncharacterized protein YdeI (BOF family)
MEKINLWKACKTLALMLFSSTLILACTQQEPQSNNSISSIAENPVQGKEVTLQGNILRKDREAGEHTDYVLSDGVNEVIIELKDKNFQFDPKETYEVIGLVGTETDEEHKDPNEEKRIEIVVKDIKKIASK